MSRRQFPILPLLLMCAIGVCSYWIYKNIEFEEVEYQVGQTDVARSNRFLAAARLMEKEGFAFDVAKNRGVFSSLSVDTTGVLWIANLNELNHEQEVDQILAWVESGGVLLTSPVGSGAFEESTISGELLSRLGIATLDDDELDTVLEQPEVVSNNNDSEYSWNLPGKGSSMPPVSFYSARAPHFKSTTADNENRRVIAETPYFVHKAVGKGFVTVYADNTMFNNSNIELLDHSYLLLWLTQPASQKKLSIVFRPADKPGLFNLLWSKFTIAVLLLLGVLIGYLRWASSRLGPIEHELPPVQNNLMAHLEARGEYWYRHKYTDKIVENVQHAAIETLAKQRGVASVAGEIDREEAIRQATKMLKCSPVTAEQALYGKSRKGNAVLNASRVLQKINHHKPIRPKS